jgi:hypothetical protein
VSALLLAAALACSTQLRLARPAALRFERANNGVFVQAQVKGETLWFVLDSGASRTLLDVAVARRLGIRATESSTIGGAGTGRVPVQIAKAQSLSLGGATLRGVDFRLLDLSGQTPAWGRRVDGIVGYDLLCHAAVTIDYAARTVTIGAAPRGDPLPLTFEGGWSFVEATIKVPGNAPVTDRFLIDTGSQDAVDHPIIEKSTGPLRRTQSGNGLGAPAAGVVGPTEWFRIGRFTIGSTSSSCCGNPATSRLLGAAVLSRFRVTFDYPHQRLYLTKPGS